MKHIAHGQHVAPLSARAAARLLNQAFTILLALLATLAGSRPVHAQQPDTPIQPNYAGLGCVASMENRSALVADDGTYALQNVPETPGLYRVHITCAQPDGSLMTAQSGYFNIAGADPLTSNTFTNVPLLPLAPPVPGTQRISVQTASIAPLNAIGATLQLSTIAYDVNGAPSDDTLAISGTTYLTSNAAVATVSADGLVTATGPGNVSITASNDGLTSTTMVSSFGSLDSDGDGMPDTYEVANGLNPFDATDAAQDPDHDGLTNLQEYMLGTNPHVADTDGDGLNDGQEVALGTNPLVADTDGDGLTDGQEFALGTNPLLADTDGDGIPDGVEVKIGTNPLMADVTSKLTGYVTNPDGTPSIGTSVVVLTYFTSVTDSTGAYTMLAVPVTLGNVRAAAEVILGGKIYAGTSQSIVPVGGGTTKMGTISLGQNSGQVSGTVLTPDQKPASNVQVAVSSGPDTRTTTTDANGLYAVNGLNSGPIAVAAFDPTTSLRGQAMGVLASGAGLTLNVPLMAFGTISGNVTNTQGQSVGAGISVALAGPLGAQTVTDGLGHYSFNFAPLGRYVLDATDANGNHGRTTAQVSATAQTVTANLQFLGRGTILGVVTDGNGTPAPGASVSLYNAGVFYQMFTTTANSAGQYSFANVFVGVSNLTAVSAQNGTAGSMSANLTADAQTLTANIMLAPVGAITGHVYRSDGTTPATGVAVSAAGTAMTATTDAAGAYTLSNLPLNQQIYVMVTDPAGLDRGQANTVLTTAGKTVTLNVTMAGIGTVNVTVVDGLGKPSPGAFVTLSSGAPFNVQYGGNTAADGTLTITSVVAGTSSLTATDANHNLAGTASVQVTPNASVNMTVMLQASGSISGNVYRANGQTPLPGVTVYIDGNYNAVTAANGTYSIGGVPSGNHTAEVLDSALNGLTVPEGLTLTSAGQALTANFIAIALGTVTGQATYTDGTPAAHVPVEFISNTGASAPYGTATDASGRFAFQQVPAGSFSLTATARTAVTAVYGFATGNLNGDGGTSVTNIILTSTLIPSTLELTDANGESYPIRENGAIVQGSFNVFAGDGGANVGGSVLTLAPQNGPTLTFTGQALAPTDLGNRQISITQGGLAGLNVTRRVYVPADGYFARYIELLENPGANPITVSVAVTTNFRPNRQRVHAGALEAISFSAPKILLTSSNDNVLNANDPSSPDHWVTFGGPVDQDPFIKDSYIEAPIPSIADVFNGPGAPLTPNAIYTQDPSGLFAQERDTYNVVTVPGGGTVGILHFVAQQNLNGPANASAARLVQLPPEALTGISQSDLASIQNFVIPQNGTSKLAPLPPITSQISGFVYGSDGVTPAAYAQVQFTSSDPIYHRTNILNADATGSYIFLGQVGGIAITAENFSVLAVDAFNQTVGTADCAQFGNLINGGCAISSPVYQGTFPGGATAATQDILFSNTGILTGTVSQGPVVLNVAGTVRLFDGPMNAVTVPVRPDGTYVFVDVLPGNYNLLASVSNTLLTGLTTTSVTANQTTTTNITIGGAGQIIGSVTRLDGTLAVGDTVNLRVVGMNPVTTQVDTSGHYSFPALPIGSYGLDVYDSLTNTAASATTAVTANSTTVQNLPLQSAGTIAGVVTVNDGSSVMGLTVTLAGSTSNATQTLSTTTAAGGAFSFTGVKPGTIVLRSSNSEGLQGTGYGALPLAGSTVTINVSLVAAGTLSGTVFQADGSTPAAGIQVTINPSPLTGSNVTATNAQGVYSFQNVPQGRFSLDAVNLKTGDRGYATNQIQANNQQRTVNVTLNGLGNLAVTVLNPSNAPVPGATVTVNTQNVGTTTVATTNGSGVAQFNALPAGPYTVSAIDPVSGFRSNNSGTIAYNGNSTITVTLAALGTIQGTVYMPDGVTPAAGASVSLYYYRSTTTAANGTYQFANIPISQYDMAVADSAGTTRAFARVNLTAQSGTLIQNFTFDGLGSVTGKVTKQDGSADQNVALTLTPANQTLSGAQGGGTLSDGTYSFSGVPVGKFTVSVNGLPTGEVGYNTGTITADGASTVVNVQIQGNAVTLPLTLNDADGFAFTINSSGVFSGGSPYIATNINPLFFAQPLVIAVSGTPTIFGTGSTGVAAVQSLNGQQVELTAPVSGLNVTRKVYVPSDGYFARRLEVLSNPTSSPITATVAIGNPGYPDRGVQNRTPLVITTSNGTPTPDATVLWTVDDDDNGQLPYPETEAAVANVVAGPGAATGLASATDQIANYQIGYGTNSYTAGQLYWTYTYKPVTIPANGSVSFLFFTAQEATDGTAITAAQRLDKLPAEALAGLSSSDLASVVNFVIPATPLAAVYPPAAGSISGQVTSGDGVTPVPLATVYAQSTDLTFGAGSQAVADLSGKYFIASLIASSFSADAHDSKTYFVSPPSTGTFAGSMQGGTAPAQTLNVPFTGFGSVQGLVETTGATKIVSPSGFSASFYCTDAVTPPRSYPSAVTAGAAISDDAKAGITSSAAVEANHPATTLRFGLPAFGQPSAAEALAEVAETHLAWVHSLPPMPPMPAGIAIPIAGEPAAAIAGSAAATTETPRAVPVNAQASAPLPGQPVYCGSGNALIASDGTFGFPVVPMGSIALYGTVNTSAAGGFYLNSGNYQTTANQTTTITLPLPPTGNITGVITMADGSPSAGAKVSVLPKTNGFYQTTTTDSSGTYTFTGLALDRYTVTATDPVTTTTVSSPLTAVTQDNTQTVNLQFIGHGTVTVNVHYANGNVGHSATVYLYLASSPNVLYSNNVTDGSGNVSFTNVPDGGIILHSYYPGQNFFSVTTNPGLSGVGQSITVPATLTPVGNIVGQVTNANGTPAASAYVNFVDVAGVFSSYAQTDSAGNYEVTTVPADRLINATSYSPNNTNNPVIVIKQNNLQIPQDGATLTVNLRYPGTASVQVTVLKADGTVNTGANEYVSLRSTSGAANFNGQQVQNGTTTFTNVVEGNFVAYGKDSTGNTSFVLGSTAFTVAPADDGTTKQVTLMQPATGTIQGTLFAGDGKTPIQTHAGVLFTDIDSATQLEAGTDSNGAYTYTAAANGASGYSLTPSVNNTNYPQLTVTGSITKQGQTDTDNFTLPVSSISGTLFLNDGVTPVPNSYVVGNTGGLNGPYQYANTDANGAFQIVGLPNGSITLTGYDQNGITGVATVTLPFDTSVLAGVAVDLEPVGTVMGTVYDKQGNLLPNVDLYVSSSGASNGYQTNVQTDANGNYIATDIAAGSIYVSTVSEFVDPSTGVQGTGTLTTNGQVITIIVGTPPVPPQGIVFGTVYDQNQNPAPGATVTVTAQSTQVSKTGTTDQNGIYNISGFAADSLSVSAVLADGTTQVGPVNGMIADVTMPTEIDLGLNNSGTVSGTITFADGTVYPAAMVQLATSAVPNTTYLSTAAADGTYSFGTIDPGTITLQVVDSNNNVIGEATGTLPYGGNVVINLTTTTNMGRLLEPQMHPAQPDGGLQVARNRLTPRPDRTERQPETAWLGAALPDPSTFAGMVYLPGESLR